MNQTSYPTFQICCWTKCRMESQVEKFEKLQEMSFVQECQIFSSNMITQIHPTLKTTWKWHQSYKKCWMKYLTAIKLHPKWFPTISLKSCNFMACANETNISSNKNFGSNVPWIHLRQPLHFGIHKFIIFIGVLQIFENLFRRINYCFGYLKISSSF